MSHLASVTVFILGHIGSGVSRDCFYCKSRCAPKSRYLGPPDLLINDFNNFLLSLLSRDPVYTFHP
jgi:hypothetical protein